jgi:hypothetical protein
MIYPPDVTGQFQIERHGYPVKAQIRTSQSVNLLKDVYLVKESLLPVLLHFRLKSSSSPHAEELTTNEGVQAAAVCSLDQLFVQLFKDRP